MSLDRVVNHLGQMHIQVGDMQSDQLRVPAIDGFRYDRSQVQERM